MTTITVKINSRTAQTRHLMQVISEMAKTNKNIEIVSEGKSPYNPEFVQKILKSDASKGKVIKTEDLWK